MFLSSCLVFEGIPEYNCVISPSKTLVNFDPATTGFSTEEVKQLPENGKCNGFVNFEIISLLTDNLITGT